MPQTLPAGLPLPLAASHGRGDEFVFADMPTGIGHPRRRRVRRRPPQSGTLMWRLTLPQVHVWAQWFESVLLAGARSFLCPLMRRGAFSVETVEMRITEPPRYTHGPGYCDVSVSVLESSDPMPADGVLPNPVPANTLVWVRVESTVGGVAWVATARTTWETHTVAAALFQLDAVPALVLGAASITLDTPNYREWSIAYTSNGTPASANLSSERRLWNGSAWVTPPT